MIIESIFAWFVSILNFAISLLPENGSIFDQIPKLTFTSLKYISLLNGYIPVNEIGIVFGIMLLVQASLLGIRTVFGLYNQLSKVVP